MLKTRFLPILLGLSVTFVQDQKSNFKLWELDVVT